MRTMMFPFTVPLKSFCETRLLMKRQNSFTLLNSKYTDVLNTCMGERAREKEGEERKYTDWNHL